MQSQSKDVQPLIDTVAANKPRRDSDSNGDQDDARSIGGSLGVPGDVEETRSSTGSMDSRRPLHGGGFRNSHGNVISMGALYKYNKEDFKAMAKEMEEMGRPFFNYVFGEAIDHAGRYLSDVFLFTDIQSRDRAIEELDNYGKSRRKGMLGYSVECDHIHIIHDCTYGGAHCRDVFRRKIQPYGIFRPARTENKPICQFRRTDWYDVFAYFFLYKRGIRNIYVRGEGWQKPTDGNTIVFPFNGNYTMYKSNNPNNIVLQINWYDGKKSLKLMPKWWESRIFGLTCSVNDKTTKGMVEELIRHLTMNFMGKGPKPAENTPTSSNKRRRYY